MGSKMMISTVKNVYMEKKKVSTHKSQDWIGFNGRQRQLTGSRKELVTWRSGRKRQKKENPPFTRFL